MLFEDLWAADATVWEEAGLLWMFVTTAPRGGSPNEELSLFFAEAPCGPWHAHPQNPVVSDVRCARPAGRLFVENGALIRPAQDCADFYGRALRLQRVEALSETEYRETPLRTLGPEWLPGCVGTHTLSRAGGFEVTDGQRTVRRQA